MSESRMGERTLPGKCRFPVFEEQRAGSLSTREGKQGLQLTCVVSNWQDVKRGQKKTSEEAATGKGRLLLSCGEKFPLA